MSASAALSMSKSLSMFLYTTFAVSFPSLWKRQCLWLRLRLCLCLCNYNMSLYLMLLSMSVYSRSVVSSPSLFMPLKGGKDPYDALSCRSFSAKEPLIIGLICRKWPLKIRHPTSLRHPVPLPPSCSIIGSFIRVLYVTSSKRHRALHRIALCCRVLPCVAVCCSVLQCVAPPPLLPCIYTPCLASPLSPHTTYTCVACSDIYVCVYVYMYICIYVYIYT